MPLILYSQLSAGTTAIPALPPALLLLLAGLLLQTAGRDLWTAVEAALILLPCSITARVPTYDHLNPHYQTTYPGSRTNQSGRPLACAGRPLASSGRPLASSGPPLPSSGRLLARSGRCLNIPGGHLHTSSVSITPGSRKYIHVSISATPDYAAALVAPR